MNGAQSLIRTLVDSGVTTCFANPGTSEMHFVKALDDVPDMRGVLALFEGVATGAADGYGRMADHPAATLLHLGSGLANGSANLHNARRAATPMVNIVGDHATHHKRFDAPLDSDIEASAGTTAGWLRTSARPEDVAGDAAEAVAAAHGPPGRIATLILPADVSWSDAPGAVAPVTPATRATVDDARIAEVATILRSGEPAAILIGGSVTREQGLVAASRVAQATGAKLLGETFPARLERGAGRPDLERLAYLAEFIEMQLSGIRHLVLADTRPPVSFFAYPGRPSDLVPEGCEVHTLAVGSEDAVGALEALADLIGRGRRPAHPRRPARDPDRRPRRGQGRRRGRRPAPGGGDRGRRGPDRRHLHPGRHRRLPPPRLADPLRRGHRHGHPPGHGRRRGLP